jgi:FixJ family two-component response regulator
VKTMCALVSVVDDDESVRESLPDLLRELGYTVQVYRSAEEFLAAESMRQTQCLILDIFMQGMSGPELIKELANRQVKIAVIFITAHFDECLRSRLIHEGAVECLFKPFSDQALSSALHAALRVDRLN